MFWDVPRWLERERLERSLADDASVPLARPVPVAGIHFYAASVPTTVKASVFLYKDARRSVLSWTFLFLPLKGS